LTRLTELYLYSNRIVDISPLAGLTRLTELWLDDNEIVDIQALVDNAGLDSWTSVFARNNYLDLALGSSDMMNIEALQSRGVRIYFDPQN